MDNNLPQTNLPNNNPLIQNQSIWISNPHLKMLLLVLIFVFLGCGIGLAVFAQLQAGYRQKIYEETQAGLPKHVVKPVVEDLKTYTSQTSAIEFQYPSNLTVSETAGLVTLNHQIPFENHGNCDMKGDPNTYPTLKDFNVSLQIMSGSVAQAVKTLSPYIPAENFLGDSLKVSPGFIDQAQIGNFSGFSILEGAEGCGHVIYYFPIANSQTLVVVKDNVQMLSGIVTGDIRDRILKVPGVITPEQSGVIFKQIITSLKVSPQADIIGWKTYKNDKYGFEFQYPNNFNMFEGKPSYDQLDNFNITKTSDATSSILTDPDDITFDIINNSAGKSFEQWVNDFQIIGSDQKIKVDGVSGIQRTIINQSLNSRAIIYFLPISGSKIIFFSAHDEVGETILSRIISTFKFTK